MAYNLFLICNITQPHFNLLYHLFVSAPSAPNATLVDAKTESVTINVSGNNNKVFDTYCVKIDSMQNCSTNGTNSTDILNITGLTAGTNYTFNVYTVYQGLLSEHWTQIQSFTSKKLMNPILCLKHMHC